MTETISIRIKKEAMDKLRNLSTLDNRSINNYVETIILKHIKEIEEQQKTPTE